MVSSENDEQRRFWSGPSGKSWIAHEAAQDALLANAAALVMAEAGLIRGDRVLDIGAGTGALAELAADAVGREGFVCAADISEPLLARASERLAHLPQVSTRLGDVADANWSGDLFDIAISRFGVMFFSNPPAAFANIARALVPGGEMVFAAWGPASRNVYWSLAAEVATAHLGRLPPSPPNSAGPMGLSSVDYAVDCLSRAGLADVSVAPRSIGLDYAAGAADLARLMVAVGPARRLINAFEAGPDEVSAIETGIANRLAEYESDGVVSLPSEINLIRAKREAV